jgi:hypothetical protein
LACPVLAFTADSRRSTNYARLTGVATIPAATAVTAVRANKLDLVKRRLYPLCLNNGGLKSARGVPAIAAMAAFALG